VAESNSGAKFVQWSTLLAVTAAVVGAVGRFAPLTSMRPEAGLRVNVDSFGYQDAEARLWQDPFQGARAHREAVDAVRGLGLWTASIA
jgi:hypothetical protein